MSRPARFLLFALRVYQSFFSALMPSACKFYPSCSHYAAEAVRVNGARRGSWLAVRRVLRCHPFSRGGVDLVPDPADFAALEKTLHCDKSAVSNPNDDSTTNSSRTGFSLSHLNSATSSQIENRQAEIEYPGSAGSCPTEVRS